MGGISHCPEYQLLYNQIQCVAGTEDYVELQDYVFQYCAEYNQADDKVIWHYNCLNFYSTFQI